MSYSLKYIVVYICFLLLFHNQEVRAQKPVLHLLPVAGLQKNTEAPMDTVTFTDTSSLFLPNPPAERPYRPAGKKVKAEKAEKASRDTLRLEQREDGHKRKKGNYPLILNSIRPIRIFIRSPH
jgi:hypothetical protein